MIRSLRVAVAAAAALVAAACTTTPPGASPGTAGTPAAGEPGGRPAPVAQASAEAPRAEPVCWYEMPTGSHIRRRVCYSQEELSRMTRSAQEEIRRAILEGDKARRER